jgi:hypothetical protein
MTTPGALCAKFRYDGVERHVDMARVLIHGSGRSVLCGMEVLRNGEKSGVVKRFAIDEVEDLHLVDPDESLALRLSLGLGERPET